MYAVGFDDASGTGKVAPQLRQSRKPSSFRSQHLGHLMRANSLGKHAAAREFHSTLRSIASIHRKSFRRKRGAARWVALRRGSVSSTSLLRWRRGLEIFFSKLFED